MFNEFMFNESLLNREAPLSQYHLIYLGSYKLVSKLINHVYVIGKDANGDDVYGEDSDNTELALIGERVDFRLQTAVRNAIEAEAVATAGLVPQRLNSKQGYIIVPPHCGIELFDVVRIHDGLAAVADQDYRVIGIHFAYGSFNSSFYQKLFLCEL